ncbi:hypothetical protein BJ742DRAFT_163042 [Cladochytrium replicatum]|nr:hypothetical protein BJ742DRAFT_163042 [Cladochytrium replicatum]
MADSNAPAESTLPGSSEPAQPFLPPLPTINRKHRRYTSLGLIAPQPVTPTSSTSVTLPRLASIFRIRSPSVDTEVLPDSRDRSSSAPRSVAHARHVPSSSDPSLPSSVALESRGHEQIHRSHGFGLNHERTIVGSEIKTADILYRGSSRRTSAEQGDKYTSTLDRQVILNTRGIPNELDSSSKNGSIPGSPTLGMFKPTSSATVPPVAPISTPIRSENESSASNLEAWDPSSSFAVGTVRVSNSFEGSGPSSAHSSNLPASSISPMRRYAATTAAAAAAAAAGSPSTPHPMILTAHTETSSSLSSLTSPPSSSTSVGLRQKAPTTPSSSSLSQGSPYVPQLSRGVRVGSIGTVGTSTTGTIGTPYTAITSPSNTPVTNWMSGSGNGSSLPFSRRYSAGLYSGDFASDTLGPSSETPASPSEYIDGYDSSASSISKKLAMEGGGMAGASAMTSSAASSFSSSAIFSHHRLATIPRTGTFAAPGQSFSSNTSSAHTLPTFFPSTPPPTLHRMIATPITSGSSEPSVSRTESEIQQPLNGFLSADGTENPLNAFATTNVQGGGPLFFDGFAHSRLVAELYEMKRRADVGVRMTLGIWDVHRDAELAETEAVDPTSDDASVVVMDSPPTAQAQHYNRRLSLAMLNRGSPDSLARARSVSQQRPPLLSDRREKSTLSGTSVEQIPGGWRAIAPRRNVRRESTKPERGGRKRGLTHSKSWPPSVLATSHDLLMNRIEDVAYAILLTPAEAMVGTNLAANLMKALQELMEEVRMLVVGNADADEMVTKLLFVFAPVSRVADSLVGCFIKFWMAI